MTNKLAEEMKTAMRAKDKDKLEALRSIKSAIMTEQTKMASGSTLSEEEELKLLQKLQKQRKDSLEIYQQQGREDLAATEKQQLEVIETFLPEQMSEEKLTDYLKEVIERTGAKEPKDMGKVMGIANKELSGKADGKTIAKLAKELLQG